MTSRWPLLWMEHVAWTRAVIVGVIDGAAGTEAYTARLLRNADAMTREIVSVASSFA